MENIGQDKYFARPLENIKPFEFDQGVADVFDDMVSRSVPFYNEIHRIIKDILNYTFEDGDRVYDLGCSTGTTIKIMSDHLWNRKVQFIGVDNSKPMIEKAKAKLDTIWHPYILECNEIQSIDMETAGFVIMNYTLQFIDKKDRPLLLKKIYDSLRPGGVFIYAEKIDSQDLTTHNLLTSLYYDFKRRQGYSDLEIAQKREALEKVLVPYTQEEQLELLRASGFKKSEMIFRWYNFACFMGIKEADEH